VAILGKVFDGSNVIAVSRYWKMIPRQQLPRDERWPGIKVDGENFSIHEAVILCL